MILFDLPPWVMLPWLFVLGAVIGSFLNVCIYRIPEHDTLWRQLRGIGYPPSRCPGCRRGILRRDNVPILGWLWLRGRCRNCRTPISMRYPLIELLNGLLFVGMYWYEIPFEYGATFAETPYGAGLSLAKAGPLSQPLAANLRYVYHMVMIEALLVASFIDFDRMIIPDASTLPAMGFALIVGTAAPQVHLVPVWYSNPSLVSSFGILLPEEWRARFGIDVASGFSDRALSVPDWIAAWPHLNGLAVSLVGLLVGGGIVWGVRLIGAWILRREAMGFGDVILMAMIGSFLGWQATVAAFFLAPAFALVAAALAWVSRRGREIPYGPYLSLGALAMLVGWPRLWPPVDRICQLGPLVPALSLVMGVLLAVCLLLLQGLKWALGVPLYPDDPPPLEWTSADTLFYLHGENADRSHGRWRTDEWPGIAAGRGASGEEAWRRPGSTPRGWGPGGSTSPRNS